MIDLVPFEEASYPAVTYNRHPVRVALLDGRSWWDTAQIFGLIFKPVDEGRLRTFAAAEMGWHFFPGEDEPLHVVTTLAAQTIASQLPNRPNIMVNAWLRKQNLKLITRPGEEPPHVPLTLLANGELPLHPAYTGHAADEWYALQRRARPQRPFAGHRLRNDGLPTNPTGARAPSPPSDPEELQAWSQRLIGIQG